MKLSAVVLLAIPAFAAAFAPAQQRAFTTSLSVTPEEDLELTRKIIMQSKEEAEKEPEPVAAGADEKEE